MIIFEETCSWLTKHWSISDGWMELDFMNGKDGKKYFELLWKNVKFKDILSKIILSTKIDMPSLYNDFTQKFYLKHVKQML